MSLVSQIHALARKCAQVDRELRELIDQVNVESLEKPYVTYISDSNDIDPSRIQEGGIIVTDDSLGEAGSVLADIEHVLSGSRNKVCSSYVVKSIADPIGAIVQSIIPLSKDNLHVLDGSLLEKESYPELYAYVGSLLTRYSGMFLSESAWQASVTQYGVCGKFVYNSTNKTVRLPLVSGIIECTTLTAQLGAVVEAGLPNITGNIGLYGAYFTSETDGAFTRSDQTASRSQTGSQNYNYLASFDASHSNSIYKDDFNKVQPQTVKVLTYMVVK